MQLFAHREVFKTEYFLPDCMGKQKGFECPARAINALAFYNANLCTFFSCYATRSHNYFGQ